MSDPGDSLVGASKPSPLRAIAIAVAVVGALGAGAWWLLGGKGQPEDPARVLIVGTNAELEPWLERRGFDPDYLSVGQAIGEGQTYDRSLDDLAAMLEYADQRGYGYLALDMAHGQTYDFSTIGYASDEPPPGTTFAVVSVGKLGETVSFGGVVPGVSHEPPSGEQLGLLFALFGQPKLAKARTQDASNDLMIRFGSARTLEDLAEYEKGQEHMRRQIDAWTKLAERERGEPRPVELAQPYEPLRGWPLANGALLLAGAREAWRSADGRSSTLVTEDLDASLFVITPADLVSTDPVSTDPVSTDSGTRIPCTALPDTLAFDGGFAIAPAGDALLIPSDRWVADLWVLAGDGCAFEQRDQIRRLDQGELGVPRASGRTAATLGGRLMWADAKMRAFRALRLPGITARNGELQWLDDDTIVMPATLDFALAATMQAERRAAVAATGGEVPEVAAVDPAALPAPREALVFAKLPPPLDSSSMQLAIVPVDALVDGDVSTLSIRDAFVLTAEPGTVVARVDAADGSRLVRLAALGDGAWRDGLALDYELADALLTRDALQTTVLSTAVPGDAHDLALAPDGRHAVWAARFGEAADDSNFEIVLLPLGVDGAQPLRLTDNDRSDLRPRFVGAGHLVFDSGHAAVDDLPGVEALRLLAIP